MNTPQTTADGLKILYQRYYANNPERQLELEKARIDDEVARKIFKIKETSLGFFRNSITHPKLCHCEGVIPELIFISQPISPRSNLPVEQASGSCLIFRYN